MSNVVSLLSRTAQAVPPSSENDQSGFETAEVIYELAGAVETLSTALLKFSTRLNAVESDMEKTVLLNAWAYILDGLETNVNLKLRT